MTRKFRIIIIVVFVLVNTNLLNAKQREISQDELLRKMSGFWIGQLVGNYMGFPFENCYVNEPIDFLVDHYYTYKDDQSIVMHRDDHRGFVPIVASAVEGAFCDDDTDIELVTLHAVEKSDGKCHIEFIMKDISTVRRDPKRLWQWSQIATEEIENYS